MSGRKENETLLVKDFHRVQRITGIWVITYCGEAIRQRIEKTEQFRYTATVSTNESMIQTRVKRLNTFYETKDFGYTRIW